MAQLNRRAAELMVEEGAHACTDITGYGLLGHAPVMATASGVALRIAHRRVLHFPAALELRALGVAPGGLAANRRAFNGKVWFGVAVPAGMARPAVRSPRLRAGCLSRLPRRARHGWSSGSPRKGL